MPVIKPVIDMQMHKFEINLAYEVQQLLKIWVIVDVVKFYHQTGQFVWVSNHSVQYVIFIAFYVAF